MLTHPRSIAVTAAVALATLAAPRLARSQNARGDTTQLQPVVVTATRSDAPEGAATLSTTVLTGAELRERGITTVEQALAQVPDVFVPRSGSYGGQTSLFIRGGNSDYTQVLVDGVPVNDPGGAIDLAGLTTDNVDRIEVVRGPASVLYGANAVTGVVQIFTRRGAAGWRAHLAARGGTFDRRDVEAGIAGGGARVTGSLAAGDHRSAGIYDFNNANRNTVASGALHLALDARTGVNLALRSGDAHVDVPTNYFGVPEDSNQFHTERRFIASLGASRQLTDRLTARVLLDATNGTTRSADLPDAPGVACALCYDARSSTYRRGADARLEYAAAGSLLLSAGAAWERQRQDESGAGAAARSLHAWYAQALGEAGPRVSYTAGVRRDANSLFGDFTTWRVSGGLRVAPATRLRVSLGTAFKEPTFDQMLSTSPFARGNPALRPERTRSWEAGVEQDVAQRRLTLTATYFAQRFRDVIEYNASPPAADDPNYVNLAAALADGVELEARWRPDARWSLAASYTQLRTRVTAADTGADPTAPYVTGARLLRRPGRLATASLSFRPSARGSAALQANYVGRRADVDFATFTRVLAPAYTTLDLSGELALIHSSAHGTSLALTARIENLLDARYQPIFGFRAPGRALLAGVRLGAGAAP